MKSRYLLFTVFTLLVTALAPVAAAGTNYGVIDGATNDLDYVYNVHDNNSGLYLDNVTDEARSNDNDELALFPYDNDSDDQYLVFGMESQFDKLFFDIDEGVDFDENHLDDLDWEYLTDDGWENLSLTQDSFDYGTNSGNKTVTWNIPSDWDDEFYLTTTAYWVRVGTDMEVDDEGQIEQISARVFNLKLTIDDGDGHKLTNLDEYDFDLTSGSDNDIYEFKNRGNGVYEFALQAEANDVKYVMEVDVSGYDQKNVTVGDITNVQKRYTVSLNDDDDDYDYYNYNYNNYDSDCEMPFTDVNSHWAQVEIREVYCRDVVQGKSYSKFDPNSHITRAEFVKIALLNAGVDVDYYADRSNERFRDVDSHDWFYEYAAAAYELDIVSSGYYFRPDDHINRAEAVTMIVRLADQPAYIGNNAFSDVDSNDWFAPYIRAAYIDGVVEGYNDWTFRPANHLTRAESAVMAANAFEAWHLED